MISKYKYIHTPMYVCIGNRWHWRDMEGKPRIFRKGFWKPEEDSILKKYVETHGEGNWTLVSKKSGLMRGAKSCRLRWKNYLRPNIKRGMMSEDERDLIIRLHKLLGNRWALIAGRLPGRTDNEVKNYWNTHLNKKEAAAPASAPAPAPQLDSTSEQQEHRLSMPQGENLGTTTTTNIAQLHASVTDSWLHNLMKMNVDYGMICNNFDATFFDNLLLSDDQTLMNQAIFL